jgi:predicted nucleic acid-binding protein
LIVVVDSSVLIAFFRGQATPGAARLRQLEQLGESYALPVVCCQEVMQGARDEREWRLLDAYLTTQQLLSPLDVWATHRAAARIYFDCRRRGLTIRSSVDCLIAQLTIDHDGVLLHDDEDFERIRQVRPLRTMR